MPITETTAPDDQEVTDDGPLQRDVGPGYVSRTLLALEILSEQPASADEIAVALGVHRRTASRLIDVMSEARWIEPDPIDRRRVRLSTRIITVAGEVLGRSDLVQVGLPFVRQLRDEVDESSHLSVPSDGWAVHVAEQPSTQPLNVAAHVGTRVPIFASAVGKVLGAWLPDQLDICIREGLERFTPNTFATPESLKGEMARILDRGYAVDDAELYPDTRCIAAPVRNQYGTVVAALGVSGPAIRLTRDRVEPYASHVVAAANGLSAALGFVGGERSGRAIPG